MDRYGAVGVAGLGYVRLEGEEYDFHSGFITWAGEIKTSMPYFVVEKFSRILADAAADVRERRLLLPGVSFKQNDIRNSSALTILEGGVRARRFVSRTLLYHVSGWGRVSSSRCCPDRMQARPPTAS
jgi:hypothetical protein